MSQTYIILPTVVILVILGDVPRYCCAVDTGTTLNTPFHLLVLFASPSVGTSLDRIPSATSADSMGSFNSVSACPNL